MPKVISISRKNTLLPSVTAASSTSPSPPTINVSIRLRELLIIFCSTSGKASEISGL